MSKNISRVYVGRLLHTGEGFEVTCALHKCLPKSCFAQEDINIKWIKWSMGSWHCLPIVTLVIVQCVHIHSGHRGRPELTHELSDRGFHSSSLICPWSLQSVQSASNRDWHWASRTASFHRMVNLHPDGQLILLGYFHHGRDNALSLLECTFILKMNLCT